MTDQNDVLPLPQDEYTGVGGAYVIDPKTGKRSPEPKTESPQTPTEE